MCSTRSAIGGRGGEGKEGKEGNEGKRKRKLAVPSLFSLVSLFPSLLLACRHNLTYWRNETYLGFGPGAHSSQDGRRWAGIKPVPAYIERVNSGESVLDFMEEIDDRLSMGETMMLGLRLVVEGVTFERFQQRHGRSMLDVFGDEIDDLERIGLLERLPDRVRLTKPARLLGDQVFARFLP